MSLANKNINSETKESLAEYAEMIRNPNKYKRYEKFEDLLKELFGDEYNF